MLRDDVCVRACAYGCLGFLGCTLRVVRVSCAVIKKHPVAWYLVTGIGLRNSQYHKTGCHGDRWHEGWQSSLTYREAKMLEYVFLKTCTTGATRLSGK